MKLLLKAIITALTDATLNALVPIADITTSFNAEDANYPCIELTIMEGGAIVGLTDVSMAELRISVYGRVSKQALWEIYDEVRGLLHKQENSVTTANRLIHAIFETEVTDQRHESIGDAWVLRATYRIIYSTSSVVATSVSSGKIYADDTDVTAVSGKEIATFSGLLTMDLGFGGKKVRRGGRRFGNTIHYTEGIVTVEIESVIFKAASLQLLWGITYNASDTLADDSTASTSYLVDTSTVPLYLQFLLQCTQTNDGKKLEIEADKAVCEAIRIPFSKVDVTVYNCPFVCLADASGNVLKVSVEN